MEDCMAIRTFALIYGIAFLLVGIAGFIPGLVTPYAATDPQLTVTSGAGHLFGLFPVNILHNAVHLLFGVWGLLAYRNVGGARGYAKAVAVIYGLFVIMGLIPGLMTTFGLVPLHGHDVWLHLLLAGVAAYFGFVARVDGARPA